MTKPISKPCILALESSGALLSVAVYRDGSIASLISHNITHGHAKDIVPTAMAALAQAGCGFEMVTHVAAGAGPGSFTGIRVALACAKGFCLAWGAKGIGVSGLQALARHAAEHDYNDSAPMLITADTRRGMLYCQFFDADGQAAGTIFEAAPEKLPALRRGMDDNAKLDMPLYVGGFDYEQLADIFAKDDVRVIQPEMALPLDAAMIAADAAYQIMTDMTPPLAPLYLAAAKLGPPKKDAKKTPNKTAKKAKRKPAPAAQG